LQLVSLLQQLYEVVWIPPAVVSELDVAIQGFSGLLGTTYPYLKVQSPGNAMRVAELRGQLDIGEAEAVALALELKANYLLVDELDGRAVARSLGIEVTGVIGVLSRAKHEGIIKELRPLLDELESGLKFFIGVALKERVLRGLGE
jgi:predicted nucleic acid-binding protein